jgi:hypothetical protein
VRQVAEKFKHSSEKTLVLRDFNFGLKESIENGLTSVFRKHEGAIILEDDLIVGQYALKYFLEALSKFSEDRRVAGICGYPICERKAAAKKEKAYFLPMTHPWGWATWRDRWVQHLIGKGPAEGKFAQSSAAFRAAMNCFGLRNYAQLLRLDEARIVSSWWIHWQLSAINAHQVSLFPASTQVVNSGRDIGGTHAGSGVFIRRLYPERRLLNRIEEIPDDVVVNFLAMDEAINSREAKLDRLIGFLGLIRRILKRGVSK